MPKVNELVEIGLRRLTEEGRLKQGWDRHYAERAATDWRLVFTAIAEMIAAAVPNKDDGD